MSKKPAKTFRTIKAVKGYSPKDDGNLDFVDLSNTDSYKGIYSIGIDDPIHGDKTVVKSKIGLGGLTSNAGGLYKRITNYYIAFPDGVWIYALLVTKNEKIVRELEREVHKLLEDKRYKSEYLTNLRKAEWFKASIQHIRNIFKQVAIKFKNQGVKVIFPSEYEP